MLRTLLVEDHEITRLGLRMALRRVPGIELVGECSNGEESIELVKTLVPDLVVMDIGLPGMDGLRATEIIKVIADIKVILLTSYEREQDISAGFRAGANAYCLKDISISSLTNAINSVMDGALWVDPRLSKKLIGLIQPQKSETTQLREHLEPRNLEGKSYGRLSERELQVLSHLVHGMSNREMAEQMFLSQETIKTHLRHVFEKLDASDRTQAAIKALKLGLVKT